MAVARDCDLVAEQFVHRQIDFQRRVLMELESTLISVCERYFLLGALYGETSDEAFAVDTGEGVNTEETIANGEIHAQIRLATAPPGEWVVIEIARERLPLIAA